MGELMRSWLLRQLIPDTHLCGLTLLFGRHFESISFLYRLLGVKVGKRVYWPGSGFFFAEPDLVEVGDFVVFGSRSEILTSDARGRGTVRLETGTNISDRCVLMPGTVLQRGAVLGSGSLTKRGARYGAGKYVGSRAGDCVLLTRHHNPLGPSKYARAFMFRRRMPYVVLPEWFHVLWSSTWIVIALLVQRLPVVIGLVTSRLLLGQFDGHSAISMLSALLVGTQFGYLATCVGVLTVDICGKWLLVGRRSTGDFSWDTSSYCQRWQLYLSLTPLRHFMSGGRDILDCFLGSPYLVWYFRALGAHIGTNVCLYPNGAKPMMTEPDLVTIGDGACVDSAVLVAHLNTNGKFSMERLSVGKNCVLRTWSRLQQGARLHDDTVLLEHTLVMPGESVVSGSVLQGWPPDLEASHMSLHVTV